MKPAYAAIYRYSLPFSRPVPVGGSCLARRDGCILRLQTADRLHCGYGEIAPLQGLHEETLQEAAGQLDTILHSGLPETPHLTM
ncbi:MAG TPA: o-succinylbenzoate synthase, partial [Prosthecochloris aestuarii]|nr:o-succinylbenzoate synthase [Prosthecochloris aestuarii]